MSAPEAPAKSGSRWRGAVGWLISAACIGFIAWKVDIGAAFAALRTFDWGYLAIGLLSLAFGYAVRIVRWAILLRAASPEVRIGSCAAPFLGSIALNNVLPFRAGDIVRITVFPAAIGVTRSSAFGSVVIERLVDVLTLAAGFAIGSFALTSLDPPAWLKNGAILAFVIGAAALFLVIVGSAPLARAISHLGRSMTLHPVVIRLCQLVIQLLHSFQQMSGVRVLATFFVLTMLVWAGEAGFFWALITGFGFHVDAQMALFAMSVITLSTLIPSSPGYVGPFHLAAMSVLVLLGASEEVATSFAVLAHLMLWAPTTLAGGIAMLLKPGIFLGTATRSI